MRPTTPARAPEMAPPRLSTPSTSLAAREAILATTESAIVVVPFSVCRLATSPLWVRPPPVGGVVRDTSDIVSSLWLLRSGSVLVAATGQLAEVETLLEHQPDEEAEGGHGGGDERTVDASQSPDGTDGESDEQGEPRREHPPGATPVTAGETPAGSLVATVDVARARVVLGVRAGAGLDETERAFRALAARHHPDRGGDPA